MALQDIVRQRIALERALAAGRLDFPATYMTVCDLHRLIGGSPEVVVPDTVAALEQVVESAQFRGETQALFLYREAADAIASCIVRVSERHVADHALGALRNLVGAATGSSQRGAAQALGSLPITIKGPMVGDLTGDRPPQNVPAVTWEELVRQKGLQFDGSAATMGRSLVAPMKGAERLFVVKRVQAPDGWRAACREAAWLAYLAAVKETFAVRFDVPEIVSVQGSTVFRLAGTGGISKNGQGSRVAFAVAFVSHSDYFVYANDTGGPGPMSDEHFRQVMFRNAFLFGRLASLGILHEAPIPLFHNRVQTQRRQDGGLYEWPRGGRLDRWLESCRYPNFGVTGIRDFEHFAACNGETGRLYERIGSQILSLLLVLGSHFRNKDPQLVGLDARGDPVDARGLFDRSLLADLIRGVFLRYYEGLTGVAFTGRLPDLDLLSARMIEEMGVDRHMDEILRVVDQEAMTQEAFVDFLVARGCREQDAMALRKGAEDITMRTGPHLGGFNQRISLPEMIEAVAALSALCIAGRYWRERFSEDLPVVPAG